LRDERVKIIQKEAGDLLVRVTLFDVYEKDDRVSYAHRLVFQSFEKTLNDDEVNNIIDTINEKIEKKGWEIR
jgi:phenylalanyl-tRNA synthetase beta subunit